MQSAEGRAVITSTAPKKPLVQNFTEWEGRTLQGENGALLNAQKTGERIDCQKCLEAPTPGFTVI